MTVTVLIVSHEQEWCLPKAVISAQGQTVKPETVLVVSDTEAFPSLPDKLIQGMREVQTDFVIPMAADDLLHPCFVEYTLEAMEDDVAAVYSDVFLFGIEHGTFKTPGTFPTPDLATNNRYPGVALIRHATYEAVGGYDRDDGMFCDWGLWLKLARFGARCVRVPESLLLYRRHDRNASRLRSEADENAMRKAIREKYA